MLLLTALSHCEGRCCCATACTSQRRSRLLRAGVRATLTRPQPPEAFTSLRCMRCSELLPLNWRDPALPLAANAAKAASPRSQNLLLLGALQVLLPLPAAASLVGCFGRQPTSLAAALPMIILSRLQCSHTTNASVGSTGQCCKACTTAKHCSAQKHDSTPEERLHGTEAELFWKQTLATNPHCLSRLSSESIRY